MKQPKKKKQKKNWLDVTMAINFWQADFIENRKSTLKVKRNQNFYCKSFVFVFLIFSSVSFFDLITFLLILPISWNFGEMQNAGSMIAAI